MFPGRAKSQPDSVYILDPLAFKPNPAALMTNGSGRGSTEDEADDDGEGGRVKSRTDGIYKPPRLAPVAYSEIPKGRLQHLRAGNMLTRVP